MTGGAQPVWAESAAGTKIFPEVDRSLRLSPAAFALLALTAAVSLLWSHYKLLDQDEFFVLQTDSVRKLAEVVGIQRHIPISLDPLVYHALAHGSTVLFGANAFALRLPSLLGFLLMQACLYLFVRRCYRGGNQAASGTAEAAALLALAFPAITATLFYAAEARPYGLLLGFYGLTLLAWQAATLQVPVSETRSRTAALVTLAAALALALNSHYFAILLLIPLCAAELTRTYLRRKLDLFMAAAIVAAMAAEVFTLPFSKAAGEFRKHYYNAGTVGVRAITQSFRALFLDYTGLSHRAQQVGALVFLLLAVLLLAAAAHRFRHRTIPLTTPEAVFVFTLAALPLFGFLLGRFVTHTLEVRYVLGAIVGISIVVAMVLAPAVQSLQPQRAAFLRAATALVLIGVGHAYVERLHRSSTLAAMLPGPALQAALAAHPDAPLYIQELGPFEVLSYYEPDPAVRKRLTLVYSAANEIAYDHHDTQALTAEHLRHFTALPIVRYEDLRRQPGDQLFVLYTGGWDWTDQAFSVDHAIVTALGPAMSGDAATVRFR